VLLPFSILNVPFWGTGPVQTITSKDNPRIKEARKLAERAGREARGRFLVEGVRLLADAWQSGARPAAVYVAEDASQRNAALAALLAEMRTAGVPAFACAPPVMAALAGTVTPQGIVAEVPLPALPLPARLSLALVLDRLRDPGNAGTLLRAAEAAGAGLAIFGPETVDPFNDKVVRAGMGAHFRLPLRDCRTWDEVEALLPPGCALYAADAGGEADYDAVDWRQPAALVVGGETEGVGPQARARARLIAIPMQGRAESLNAAMAGTVILFEAARQRRTSA
jgi:TrmH family RNA methyltransferase